MYQGSPGNSKNPPLCTGHRVRCVELSFSLDSPPVAPSPLQDTRQNGICAWRKPSESVPSNSSRLSSSRRNRQNYDGKFSTIQCYTTSRSSQEERDNPPTPEGQRRTPQIGTRKGYCRCYVPSPTRCAANLVQMGARKSARLRRRAGRTKKING